MSPLDSSPTWMRFITPVAVLAAVALGVFTLTDRLAMDQRAADRRALAVRADELTARALLPGSALACLDAGAGEAAESACETSIFATPQSTAAAVAYIGARLTLLGDVQTLAKDDITLTSRLAAARRAIEIDRYGIAAHVLAANNACSPGQCAAFALVSDTGTLKANMKAQAFDQYVSRHTVAWNALPPDGAPQVSSISPSAAKPAMQASVEPMPGAPAAPSAVPGKYDYPSAASIPPVSIMNAEPALPKEAREANAAAAAPKSPDRPTATDRVPVPPRRPQAAQIPSPAANDAPDSETAR